MNYLYSAPLTKHRNCSGCCLHSLGFTPKDEGTRRTILEDRGTLRGPFHLSDLSDRGIPKASRIVVNFLTPSGDLSAGIKRRQLFHFLELTIEIEGSKITTFLSCHFETVASRKQPVSS
jgi:hypothetical protein